MAGLSLVEVMNLRAVMRNNYLKKADTFRWLAHFISPNQLMSDATDDRDKSRMMRAIIKNKGGLSLRTFTSGMSNGATPRARPWFTLGVHNESKNNMGVIKKHFSMREKILNSYFQIGNLYRVLPGSYSDVGLFGTSCYLMLPNARFGFWFYPQTMGTYGFACDAEGNPNMFYRDINMTVQEIIDTYAVKKADGMKAGIDFGGIPEWVISHYKAGRYLETCVLSQVIVINKDYWPSRAAKSFKPEDKKYVCYTYVHATGGNLPPQANTGFRTEIALFGAKLGSPFVRVSGYNYFPVILPRWEVRAGSVWGVNQPGEIALGDVMTINEMEKGRLEGVHKLLKPPMVGHSSLKRHQSSILPGGITYVDDAGALAGFKPAFTMDPKLYELIECSREYQGAVEEAFFVDLFRQFSSGDTKTHVTAEEIKEKSSERMAMVSPALGQLDFDQNSKVIENGQIMLEDAGIMPPRPREIQDDQIRIEYISIMAQAAKASMMTSAERGANFAISFAQSTQQPELINIIDGEKFVRKYLEYLAVDPELIRDEDEIDQIRQQLRQKAQAQQQLQNDNVAAKTAKDLSQAEPGQGTLLDTWMEASNG